jgi:hypothetical protein
MGAFLTKWCPESCAALPEARLLGVSQFSGQPSNDLLQKANAHQQKVDEALDEAAVALRLSKDAVKQAKDNSGSDVDDAVHSSKTASQQSSKSYAALSGYKVSDERAGEKAACADDHDGVRETTHGLVKSCFGATPVVCRDPMVGEFLRKWCPKACDECSESSAALTPADAALPDDSEIPDDAKSRNSTADEIATELFDKAGELKDVPHSTEKDEAKQALVDAAEMLDQAKDAAKTMKTLKKKEKKNKDRQNRTPENA